MDATTLASVKGERSPLSELVSGTQLEARVGVRGERTGKTARKGGCVRVMLPFLETKSTATNKYWKSEVAANL